MSFNTDQASLQRIVLSNDLPREGSGILVHYEHQPVKVTGWAYRDVREVVSLNEDQWLSGIEEWHRGLSERAMSLTRWWPLLHGSRLILWRSITPFELKPILFTLAVIELSNRQPVETVWIVGAPDEVAGYLTDWAAQGKSVLIERRGTKAIQRGRARFVEVFRFWLKLAKQVASIASRCAFHTRTQIEPATVIVNSLVLNPELLRTKGDHFFGQMIDRIDGLSDKNTIWIYPEMGLANQETKSELAAIKRRAYFMPDLFRWPDLWFALRTAFDIRNALKPLLASHAPLHAGDLVSPNFSVNFISSQVAQSPSIFELVLYRQWERILKKSGVGTIVYPYEEKPLERAMLLAVRDFAPGVRTIGFAHAAYSKAHLYLRRGCHGEPPRPDIVAVTGEIARRFFEKIGVPPDQIVAIGSPRHYSEKCVEPALGTKQRKQLLLLIGHGFELRIFASMAESKPGLFDKYDLVIRRYPYAWIGEQNAAEVRMRAAGIVYRSEAGDLLKQIDESDIVLFESTSAGMEASLRGKLVIRLNLSDIVSTNHFYGDGNHDEIAYCRDIDELGEKLEYIASLTPSQYAMIIQRQRNLVANLYSPINQVAVSALLKCDSH